MNTRHLIRFAASILICVIPALATAQTAPRSDSPTAAEQRGIIIVGGKSSAPTSAGQVIARPPTTVLTPATRATSTARPSIDPNTPIQSASTPSQRPGMRADSFETFDRMLCQGFDDGRTLPTGRYGSAGQGQETYLLYVAATPTLGPTPEDGSALSPGTCAFVGKSWGDSLTKVLRVTLPDPDAHQQVATLSKSFADPNRYWEFFVARIAQTGEYVVERFGEWQAPPRSMQVMSSPGPNLGQSRQAIVGGEPIARGVMQQRGLLRLASNGGVVCSAVLLYNKWALSAAHCTEGNSPMGTATLAQANSISVQGAWDATVTQPAVALHSFRPLDVVLIELARPLPVLGATHGFRQLVWSDGPYRNLMHYDLMFMGRGISSFAQQMRDSSGKIVQVIPSFNDDVYRFGYSKITAIDQNLLWFENANEAITAGGDSGGPSFAGDAVSRGLIGVHSQCRLECAEGKMCGDWSGAGPQPAGYSPWQWVTRSTACADAPIEPVYKQILGIIANATPPEASQMQVHPIAYGAVRYDLPTIKGEDGRRHYLDACERFGQNCGGAAVAANFCATQDRTKPHAVRFEIRRNVGASAILKDGQVCFGSGCGGYAQITCANRAQYEYKRDRPAVETGSDRAAARKSAVDPRAPATPAPPRNPPLTPR